MRTAPPMYVVTRSDLVSIRLDEDGRHMYVLSLDCADSPSQRPYTH